MKYEIKGGPFPVVICVLDQGEVMVTSPGAMSWMSANMTNEAKLASAGSMLGRLVTGEKLSMNNYSPTEGQGFIAFASDSPGEIRPLTVDENHTYICQKGSFLASTAGVTLSSHINSNIGVGIMGGEGFVMQKLSGNGVAFVELRGAVIEYALEAGQTLVVSTGHLAFMEDTVTMNVKKVEGGLKNVVLGGEGLTQTTLTGPGHVWLTTIKPQIHSIAKSNRLIGK
jgi:uncharacterized protein (AIM24 family)